MQLTRGCEYAIRGLVYLGMREQGEPVLLADIAQAISAPTNYLSNIFQILTRLGLVSSHRGAKRGYTLARAPNQINLREVVEGMEGPITISSCNVEPGWCEHEGDCSMFAVWGDIQETIAKKLEKATLAKLSGSCFLEVNK